MKTLKYKNGVLVLLVIIFGTVVSCKKALDISPKTEYANEDFYASTSQAYSVLYGAYNRLQVVINQEFIYYGESRSDNVAYGGGSISNNTLSVVANNLDGNLDYSDWGNFYAVVKQANLLIKNVPLMRERGVVVKDADYNKIIGQAYGLRALAYFYLVRIWGNVPLITDPIDQESNLGVFKTPRVNKDTVYKLISTDLIKARSLLLITNSNNQETRGMLTRGAIDAIQTDFYMWRNMPDSAIVTSLRLIKADGTPAYNTYKLVELYNPNIDYKTSGNSIDNSPYSLMFTQGLSEESIFEVLFSFDENITSNIYGIYGDINAQFQARDPFVASFDLDDLRVPATFRSTTQIYKFFPKTGFDRSTQNDKNVIIYRLADVMLLRAEALNTQGDRDNAFVLVNKIRVRAGIPTINSTEYNAYTIEQAHEVILQERRQELCFEGKRWFDLVRTGKAIETMQPINGLSDVNNLVWPINFNVIRRNELIEQNEFYK